MEENKNEFEDMYNEFEIEETEVDVKDKSQNVDISKEPKSEIEDEEVSVDQYIGIDYIPTPAVGKSVEFTVKTILNIKDKERHKAVNKITGEEFVTGVKKKDETTIRIDVVTDEDKHFVLNSWSLFNLFQKRDSVFAQEVKKRGTYKGIKVRINRHFDGSVASKKTEDVKKLYDFETLEEAENYKKTVAKAMKDNMLATLEIINDKPVDKTTK